MAAQLVDLHLHSTFSDGRYTPTMLVDEAVAKGIGVIAITDHDSWNGMAEAREAAKRYGGRIRVLTGVELGTQYEDDAVHILGYHVSMECEALHKKMDEMRHAREHRLYAMLEKLDKLGYHVEVDSCDPKNRAARMGPRRWWRRAILLPCRRFSTHCCTAADRRMCRSPSFHRTRQWR